MTAQELRIGNYYDQFGNIHQANWVTIKVLSHNPEGQLWCKPVPLTEDWLKRFGFEKHKAGIGGADMWQGMDAWSINESGWLFRGNPKNGLKLVEFWNCEIKYVHELQNIYWALFKTELTPSEK